MQKKTKIVAAIAGLMAVSAVVAAVSIGMIPLPFGPRRLEPPRKDMAVDGAVRGAVITEAVAVLQQHYVFPDKVTQLAQALQARQKAGGFDSIASAEKFAEALTDSLQQDGRDRHLEVRYFEKEISATAPEQDGSQESELDHQARLNFGFETIGRLPLNIGYIDLHAFGRLPQTGDRIAAAMALLSDTKALIIDLRKCNGGDPDTVAVLASYLYDKPTHLNDVYFRDGNRTEAHWTADTVPGKRYGQSRKVYLLTSQDTFSGCEDFAYALKNNGRATVVGESTGGGAHPGQPHRVGAHFMMFVPDGRSISPVTGTDWEGVGVVPDVKVPAKRALDQAKLMIMKERLARERQGIATATDPEEQEKLRQEISGLE